MNAIKRMGWAALAILLCAALSGCGTPGAPQPPSLNLPDPVGDLSAIRTGNNVALSWTMPKRNTDKTAIKMDVEAHVCRREGNGACEPVGAGIKIAAGKSGSAVDTLANSLATGTARPIVYFVELRNTRGRSAGPSNAASVLAGEAPAPVEGLKAEVLKQGIVLSWIPNGANDAVRLERKKLSAAAARPQQGLLAPQREPDEEKLLVDSDAGKGRALDKSIHFGDKYAYRAQRVARVVVDGKALELAGAFSPAVEVDAENIFPPAVPVGLAAVATAGVNGGAASIDLSWQPDTESDLAGYVVYRREGDGAWQRISGATPMVEPAFHDAEVQVGHTYRYALTAVSKEGPESARSDEAQETVPQP